MRLSEQTCAAPPNLAALSTAAKRELHRRTCARDPLYWIEHHGYIKDERSGKIYGPGLKLWPSQILFVKLVLLGLWLITGKARQIGVSWLLRNLEAWSLLFEPNVRLGIIAQDENHAKMHLERVRTIIRVQPPWLTKRRPQLKYDNMTKLGLATSTDCADLSLVEAHPCESSAARGLSGRRIVCEELAFWPNAEEVWPGIIPAVADSGGQIVIASTANGEGNKYHQIYLQAIEGRGGFTRMFFPWQTHPDRDATWYARTLSQMGSLAKMQQEYPDNEEEMFLASGARFFSAGVLKALERDYGCEPLAGVDVPPELRSALESRALLVWELPLKGRQYLIGADTANGGGDACVGHVIDARTGEQVAKYSSHVPLADDQINDLRTEAHDFGLLLVQLAIWYNHALLGWEDNNMGIATGAAIMRVACYRNLYERQEVDPARQKTETKPGWNTNSASRPQMLGGLQNALGDAYLKPRDAVTYRQLRQFAWIDGKPQAPKGLNDDEVLALGVAEMVRQHWQLHNYEPLILAV